MATPACTESSDSGHETEYAEPNAKRPLCIFRAFNELTDECDDEGRLLHRAIESAMTTEDAHTPPHIVLFKTFVVYRIFVKRLMTADADTERIAALARFLRRLEGEPDEP